MKKSQYLLGCQELCDAYTFGYTDSPYVAIIYEAAQAWRRLYERSRKRAQRERKNNIKIQRTCPLVWFLI